MEQKKTNSKETCETGISQLDTILGGGFYPGSFNVIAAQPAAGKTSLAIQIASHLADHGKEIAFFSLESDEEEIRKRIRIQGGDPFNNKLFCECRSSIINTDHICNTVINSGKCDAIFIDYLQLLPDCNFSNIDTKLHILKYIAKHKGIPIIIVSQYPRNNERWTNLDDMSKVKSSSQKADTEIFILRTCENSEFIVSKDRSERMSVIPTISIPIIWNKEKMKFEEHKS